MDKRIAKLYKAQTLATYNDILAYVIANYYDVNINADRDTLNIVIEFNESDDVTQKIVSDRIDNMEVIVEDTFTVKASAEDDNIITEIATYKERCANLQQQLTTMYEERAKEKQSKEYYSGRCDRIKEQVRAIGVLIDAIQSTY